MRGCGFIAIAALALCWAGAKWGPPSLLLRAGVPVGPPPGPQDPWATPFADGYTVLNATTRASSSYVRTVAYVNSQLSTSLESSLQWWPPGAVRPAVLHASCRRCLVVQLDGAGGLHWRVAHEAVPTAERAALASRVAGHLFNAAAALGSGVVPPQALHASYVVQVGASTCQSRLEANGADAPSTDAPALEVLVHVAGGSSYDLSYPVACDRVAAGPASFGVPVLDHALLTGTAGEGGVNKEAGVTIMTFDERLAAVLGAAPSAPYATRARVAAILGPPSTSAEAPVPAAAAVSRLEAWLSQKLRPLLTSGKVRAVPPPAPAAEASSLTSVTAHVVVEGRDPLERLPLALASGSPVVYIVSAPGSASSGSGGARSWFSSLLVPWRHFVPVRDAAEAGAAIAWLEANPALAHSIGAAARELAAVAFARSTRAAYAGQWVAAMAARVSPDEGSGSGLVKGAVAMQPAPAAFAGDAPPAPATVAALLDHVHASLPGMLAPTTA